MSENWDVYFGYIDDKVASVVIDMDIFNEINTEEYQYAHCLRLNVKNPNEDGFPIDAEADQLGEIEESVIDFLAPRNFINVGRVTTDGVRDIIFYSSQDESDSIAVAAQRFIQPTGYEASIFQIEEDENWEFYFEYLYPNQYQLQHIGNRQVVGHLESSGDTLEVPRKVEHWLYFENTKMMKRFAKAVKKEGFILENETHEEGKYILTISRVDLVDFHSISEVTDLLVKISEQYEGEYDGWETMVIKG
ncbi:DUF695 domain-containing protein [Bacillus sp. MRMR6]|uniref:DUF695 domain-containing protein n=1 Tax=Bacillus sp. MRMR6 TaxID=1928617 RepID=UPI000950F99B|nr:DUF695 domain-containing protein [Bacillus sp. MRMR6]OLS40047.1 hypothetical protein BTR25_11255 [Bacillus sp. MRMR6]